MASNPYVNKVTANGVVIVDLTADTVTPQTLYLGTTAHDASGAAIVGTMSGGDTEAGTVTQDAQGYLVLDDEAPSGRVTVEALSVTQNGTYTAQTGKAYSPVTVSVGNSYTASDEGKVVSNGALVAQTAMASSITANGTYDTTTNNSVTVNVSGGGGTSWTLLNSIDVQYSTVSSTASSVTSLVISESYDPTKILWISVRDTQGKRAGYYYGSDCIYLANTPNNSPTSQYCLIRSVGTSNGFWQSASNAAYAGIYPVNPRLSNNNGMTIPIQGKYNTTYATGTIDSTYRISAYYVDYPSELAPIGVTS